MAAEGVRSSNYSGLGDNVLSIGRGGFYATMQEAIYERSKNTQQLLVEFTGSVSDTVGGTVEQHVISADSGSPLSAHVGKKIGIRIDGDANPIINGFVLSDASLFVINPIDSDYASVQIEVFEINYASMVILPGTKIEIPAGFSGFDIPSFTTVSALASDTVEFLINAGGLASIFAPSQNKNQVHFKNLTLGGQHDAVNAYPFNMPSGYSQQKMCDHSISDCKVFTQGQDGIWYGDNGGGLVVSNCEIHANYDCMRIRDNCRTVIKSNIFVARSMLYALHTEASAIPIGSNTYSDYPQKNYFISNNKILAYGVDGYGVGEPGHVRAVEIRLQVPSNAKINIVANEITAQADSGSHECGCIKVASTVTGANTPSINAISNILKATHSGAATPYIMDSQNANYIINRAGNLNLGGNIGINTSAVATV